jgi:hypothetical protein
MDLNMDFRAEHWGCNDLVKQKSAITRPTVKMNSEEDFSDLGRVE